MYLAPNNLDAALDALSKAGTRVIAGGTDVYPAHGASARLGPVVDVSRMPDLTRIERCRDYTRIGAAVTWRQIADTRLPAAFDGLRAAARQIGSVQIQNAGTIGGNLCTASPAADGVPPLLVLDASVELAGAGGSRVLPLAEFLTGPRQTALRRGELLTAIHVPHPPHDARSAFVKLGSRRYLVISIAMAAAQINLDGAGRIAEAKLACGACSPVARRLAGLEAALPGTDPFRVMVGASDLAPLAPIDDMRGTARYRWSAAARLCERAVREATAS